MPHDSTERVKTYLFACVHNAGRSQMAAALFNIHADRLKCAAISAGTEPAQQIHPEVQEAMNEIGIDLSSNKPRKLTAELAETCSVLVTMGCGEACPLVPGLKMVEWNIPDPKGQSPEVVRAIRDDIQEKVKRLIRSDCGECCVIPEQASSHVGRQ